MDKTVRKKILNLVVVICVAAGIGGIGTIALILFGKIRFNLKYAIVYFCFLMSILLSIYQMVKGKTDDKACC